MQHKKSHSEEDYFAREEAEKIKRLAEKKHQEIASQDREKLKKLHWMNCPKCGLELHTVVFRGINVDKCFACEGMFLDKGEIEKLAGEESSFIHGLASLFKF